MAEQISRRAQNVTNSQFEGAFENHRVRFGSGTLNLKDSLDAMEGWARHTNLWHQSEGEATARPGQTVVATHGGETICHSIRKLHDPGGPDTRFWGVGSALHRGLSGATAPVSSGYSGQPLALLPHRPPLSGVPWMFVGDASKMAKVRADGLALPIGLPAPATPAATHLASECSRAIAQCDPSDGTQASAWTPAPGHDGAGTVTGVPAAPVPDFSPTFGGEGIYCVTAPATVVVPFDDPAPVVKGGYDSWWGLPLDLDLTHLTDIDGGAVHDASDDDLIRLSLKTSHPDKLAEIRLYVVVSELFDPLVLPGVKDDAGKNSDAYVKAFRPNDYVEFVQAVRAQIDAAEDARIHALRDKDSETRRYDDTRPSWQAGREQSDPGRARSFQIGLASQQWYTYGLTGAPFRRGDFQRIGSTAGRNWATVTGLIIYVRTVDDYADPLAIGVDGVYLTGGWGPDTSEPGAQPYDYRVTHYDPRTGAESNGSDEQIDLRVDPLAPETAVIDPARRRVIVTPPAYGDAAVRQRIYRRGGSLIDDWYFCGENAADGGPFTDEFSDAEIVGAGTLPSDHYQPVPTVTEDGDTVLAQPVSALWGPVEGMLFACGDPYRPGHAYYCVAGQPDHWSATGNVEVCAPSEELLNGGIAGHQAFVFSRARMYFLYPNLSGGQGVTAAPSLCTRGLLGRWSFCTGPGGLIFFVAEDGVFATDGGPEDWLSEKINPLFYGTAVNGYQPIDKTQTAALRLTVWENDLYFQYQDTSGVRQVLVFSILQKFWRHYRFGKAPAVLQGVDEDVLLMGGLGTGVSYSHSGTSDDGAAIACTIRTGSASGERREEKLFGDLFLDADPAGTQIDVQVYLNEETHIDLPIPVTTGVAGRQRFILDPFGPSPQKAHSIACELRWATAGTPPTLYQLGYAITLQPDITNKRVTNWDDLNSPDEVWLTGVTLDCDTGGQTKTVLVERDFDGTRSLVDTLTVTAANRHKIKFSWPAVPANLVRLRPEALDCVTWILYRADWIYVQEPPRIAAWDIHFENQWDQYYTGLDLYCDTAGAEKRIEVYVDGVRLAHPATSEPFWRVQTTGRQTVHLTLPWGRGHVFRFVAIDEAPGLLYTHRWQLQPEPSEQTNWNQNFSILGTRADKWLKAVIFECDTYGVDKQVQVEVDGTVVETLTVNTNGRKVVQLALNQQALGRVWRLFPVDSHPGRLYSAEPLFDEEPFALDRWETQETNHGLPGWFYPLYGHITLKSTADVTLTTYVQHNQVGDTTTHAYAIPSTGGQKQRRFLNGFQAGKGVLIKYVLTSAAPFWLYRDETTIVIQPWGAARAITVQPFGNDDLDPSRPMTHAVLAAQASGGAAAEAPA
jgi:hypothetical protein